MEVDEEIRARATFDGQFVRVDRFLNHRVEPTLLGRIGERFAGHARDHRADLILTPEASGIPVAAATSFASGLPFVYAKKYPEQPPRFLTREVVSATKGGTTILGIDPEVMPAGARILIVDDILAGGSAALALVDMSSLAGCLVVGACVAIDKAFAGGRRALEAMGVPVHAIVTYADVDELVEPRR